MARRALAPLGTDADKPFLETAPWLDRRLCATLGRRRAKGRKIKHYYVPESVSIAIGLLIASLHSAGLATLTHTPSPMGFLNQICGRPDNEKPLGSAGGRAPGEQCPGAGDQSQGRGSQILFWKVGT
jgi:iodotyrosine deiodinase